MAVHEWSEETCYLHTQLSSQTAEVCRYQVKVQLLTEASASAVVMQKLSKGDCTRVCVMSGLRGGNVRKGDVGRKLLAGLLTVIRCGEYSQECSFDGKCVVGSVPETIEEESLLLFRCTRL